jgi:hypothetical protein
VSGQYIEFSRVEAGKNTATVALRVVRGDGKGTELVSDNVGCLHPVARVRSDDGRTTETCSYVIYSK